MNRLNGLKQTLHRQEVDKETVCAQIAERKALNEQVMKVASLEVPEAGGENQ